MCLKNRAFKVLYEFNLYKILKAFNFLVKLFTIKCPKDFTKKFFDNFLKKALFFVKYVIIKEILYK